MKRTHREPVGRKVRAFYEGCSFPGYEEFETPFDFEAKAHKGIYAKLLDAQLPLGVRILDAGCGTGQLAIFLSMVHRKVTGVDFSHNSLRKGNEFKKKFKLRDVSFAQMDLFHLGLKPESFDYIFCNGVLHHTADAYGAFQNLCRLLKPGGYITIGLYHTYGRLFLDLRRWMFNLTRGRFKWVDFYMRQKSLGEEKKRVWFDDQYRNPHDTKFTVSDVLRWFQQNHIAYINSVPKIKIGQQFTPSDRLFEQHDPGGSLDHFLCQLGWVFTKGREGGFFLTIGRKMLVPSNVEGGEVYAGDGQYRGQVQYCE
jgi:ubiquinone/menaquinone biosynthesis C-methylase UbiE